MVRGRKTAHMAKKHVPPTRFPDAAAVSYYRTIDKLVQEAGKATLAIFDTHLKEYIDSNRADSSGFFVADGLFDKLKQILNRLSKAIEQLFSKQKATKAANLFMKNLNQNNKTNMEQQARVKGINPADSEPWLTPFMKENVEKNVGYITNIRDDYTEKIENIVLDGVNNGSSHKQIRQQLEDQIDMSRRRAEFVAVDQTGSLFGQMTAQRHQNMGVNRFRWRTSKDERVRDTHKVLEDKIFSYDDPPAVGLPGEDFHCRCIALPIFDDDEEEEVETQAAFLKNRQEINENIEQNNPDISTEFRDYVSTATEQALNKVRTDFPKVDFENVMVDNGLFVEYDEEFTGIAAYFRRALYINTSFGSIQKTEEFITQSAEEGMFVKTKQGGMLQVIAHELGHAIEEQLIGIRNVEFQSELHELVKNYNIREQLSEYAEEEYLYGNHMELLSEAIALHYLGESTALSEKIVKLMKEHAKR